MKARLKLRKFSLKGCEMTKATICSNKGMLLTTAHKFYLIKNRLGNGLWANLQMNLPEAVEFSFSSAMSLRNGALCEHQTKIQQRISITKEDTTNSRFVISMFTYVW